MRNAYAVVGLMALAGCEGSCAESAASSAAVPEEPEEPEAHDSRGADDLEPGEEGDFQLRGETLEALEELGYVESAPTDNPDQRGVTARVTTAWPGLNVYSSRHRATAILTNLEGDELHRWSVNERGRSWMHVEPLPGGDILALTRDRDVTRHDRDSEVVWRTELRAHHDLAVHPDGRLFVLVRRPTDFEVGGDNVPVLADGIAILSPDGERLRTVRLLPLLWEHVHPNRFRRILAQIGAESMSHLLRPGGLADVLHTNSIEILDRPIEGVAPEGSVLLSVRELDRILILDPTLSEVLWIWGRDELEGQHDATQLDDGNLLVFDNGTQRGRSRVLEVNPVTREIDWSYEEEDLYTQLRGGAQKLPNGNVLITESDTGHAFEVTASGETVWEFWNPDVHGQPPERAVIYRLNRFEEGFFADLLSEPPS